MRNRISFEGSTGKSIYYFKSELGKWYTRLRGNNFNWDNYGYVSLFVQDVKSSLFPYFKKKHYISVEPNEEESIKNVIFALGSNEYKIEEALWNFIDMGGLLEELLISGKIYFEIISDKTNKKFVFRNIPNYSIIKFGPLILQYVPLDVRKKENLPFLILLENKDIFLIELPFLMKWKIKKMIYGLKYINSKIIIPKCFSKQMEQNYELVNYDYNFYKKKTDHLFASITKDIGWDGRKAFNNILEYYSLKRRMRFERFQLELRNSIIKGINIGLKKSYINEIAPSIKCQNFLSLEDIENAEKDLLEGNKNFNDIMKPFWRA